MDIKASPPRAIKDEKCLFNFAFVTLFINCQIGRCIKRKARIIKVLFFSMSVKVNVKKLCEIINIENCNSNANIIFLGIIKFKFKIIFKYLLYYLF